jgi:hypothetical protein
VFSGCRRNAKTEMCDCKGKKNINKAVIIKEIKGDINNSATFQGA